MVAEAHRRIKLRPNDFMSGFRQRVTGPHPVCGRRRFHLVIPLRADRYRSLLIV